MKKQCAFLMTAVMLGCLLAGCGDTRETSLPDAQEQAFSMAEQVSSEAAGVSSVAEPAGGEIEKPFSFADIADREFYFASGAGAWCTVLTVDADGSFEGNYHDADADTLYFCNFTGKFTEPKKVDDYTYSVKIERIELEKERGTKEDKDGIHYIYSEPYGLDGAEELYFYLPGVPIENLPEGYLSWVRVSSDKPHSFYGLYNVTGEYGFSSHKKG